MNKLILILSLLLGCIQVEAQFGSLVNKTKNKVEAKISENLDGKNASPKTSTANSNSNSKAVAEEKPITSSSKKETQKTEVPNSDEGNIIFSTEPSATILSSGSNSFKSNQAIYGQLQLKEGTLKSFFKIPEKDAAKKRPYYFLYYITELWKDGRLLKENSQVWTTCFVSDEYIDKSYFNFDVLPNPNKVQTVLKPLDDFTGGSSGASLINWIDEYTFSKEGKYTVKVKFTYPQNDVWGKRAAENTWPVIENEFSLNFSHNDVPTLLDNKKKVNDAAAWLIIKAQPMPKAWTAKSNAISSGYSADVIKAAYKKSLANWGNDVTIVKMYADAGTGSSIIKDDFGLPVRKSYNQQYVAFCKKPSTGHCFFQEFYIFNQYAGAGTYSKQITVGTYDAVYVTCDKMK